MPERLKPYIADTNLCFWNVMECDKIEKKLGNLSGLVLGAFSHHLITVINDRVGF